MSRLAMVAMVFMASSHATMAAVLVTEPFDQGGTLGSGVYSDWTSFSGTGAQLAVSADNGLEFGASDRDYVRGFASQSGPVYFGIDLEPQALPTSGSDYFLALNDGNSYIGRLFIAPANGGAQYNLGLSVSSGSAAVTSSANFPLTQQRVVAGYNSLTGAISLWAGTFNEGSPLLTTTGALAPEIDGFAIRQAGAFDNGGSSIFMKNLVVSDEFATAAVPEPSTLALGGLAALAGCTVAARRLRGTVATKN